MWKVMEKNSKEREEWLTRGQDYVGFLRPALLSGPAALWLMKTVQAFASKTERELWQNSFAGHGWDKIKMPGHFYSGRGKYLSFSQAISFYFTGSALWPFISEIKFSLHITLKDTFYLRGGEKCCRPLKHSSKPPPSCSTSVRRRWRGGRRLNSADGDAESWEIN